MRRDHWPAVDARGGHPVRIGAEISSTQETVEALGAVGQYVSRSLANATFALVSGEGQTCRSSLASSRRPSSCATATTSAMSPISC
jgi:hypothetical protein